MKIWIDRGGTFTDCIAFDPESRELRTVKVLSSDHAPLEGIRRLLGLAPEEPIPACEIRMGTTLATNALLERKGHPTLLVITRGFGDLLEIGTQARPDLFALDIRKPEILHSAVLEVDARRAADGTLLAIPDLHRLESELRRERELGTTSVAIVVLHDHADGGLERAIAGAAARAGFEYVSTSHGIAPEIGLLARADTTVLDAYLTPALERYFAVLGRELRDSELLVMQSSGRLASAERCRGPHAILSGPAGGVLACASIARSSGISQLIALDMGGTSTDISRFAGELDQRHETVVAGVRLRAPMLAVHTIAAGGGSLCRFDGHRLSVGPESAGARPGPLCYGNPDAREPALTDVNLCLGRLLPDAFPFPLDAKRAGAGLEALADRVRRQTGDDWSPLRVAEGLFEIANQNMADAINEVSVARGYDVRQHALCVFGGAGAQHACALVAKLGMSEAVFHPLGSVLSAFGIGLAELGWNGSRETGRQRLSPTTLQGLGPVFERLVREGEEALARDGNQGTPVNTRRVELCYAGTDNSAVLPLTSAVELEAAFHIRHEAEYGYSRPGHPLEILRVRVEVTSEAPPDWQLPPLRGDASPTASRHTRLFWKGAWLEDVPVYDRDRLGAGARVDGPALVVDPTGTLVVDPGFELDVRADGLLVARMQRARDASWTPADVPAVPEHDHPDPVLLQIYGNRFMSIAERMGYTLQRTAMSVNIRERLDYSCALFDPTGELVANAPHIPVHLGAMSESVRAVIRARRKFSPGEAFITNDPALGGSHLPDITLVGPVHDADGRLVAFVAARGHHSDIGGTSPGSMPPFSRTLAEEGIVFRGERIVSQGVFARDEVLAMLGSGRHPARDPLQNVADIEAALAALRTGSDLVRLLCSESSSPRVLAYMGHLNDYAAALLRAALSGLGPRERRFVDALDDGARIAVSLRPDADGIVIDFAGSAGQLPNNLNAPRAVTLAAVMYFLRTLVQQPIPLNGGFMKPVRVAIPESSVLNPDPGCAVAAGNVETSQRVVDVLLGAAELCAASQGTMNNLSFGAEGYGYYETIAGGAGAGPAFHGASGVHTHMTNTRITDPEILEARFPVRLLEMSIRRASGGRGAHSGGDGICRELRFLEPCQVSIISERRTLAPFGLQGGEPGKPGRNLLNGTPIPAKATFAVASGDVLRIETPGGGGFGRG